MSTFVLPLADSRSTLEAVGGKGMSLAKLAQAGLPVPGGFHLTTEAYRAFVAANGIQPRILETLLGADAGDPARLETISQQIAGFFASGEIPPAIAAAIAEAYTALPGGAPVAVRSSATAEDLPGASFAGQQETYLNICGVDAVLAAVKQCWASLWTARAIAYRAKQDIAPETIALAVVVQEMVFADVSGVLFTANPLTGNRSEMMVTATWGLGEALVGGMVTPDTLIVDRSTGKTLRREISEKQVMTVRAEDGTREQPVSKEMQKKPALSDAQAAELAGLGSSIEELYSMPMDVEWTLAGGRFAIVQARPITALPEKPVEWIPSNNKTVLMRGSFAEFVPEPVSPLFATLAVPIAEHASQKLMQVIWKTGDGPEVYFFDVINGYVYIGVAFTPGTTWKMILSSTVQAKQLLRSSMARWTEVRSNIRDLIVKWDQNLASQPATALVAGVREIFRATADYYTVAQSGPIPTSMMSEMLFGRLYQALVKRKSDPIPSIFLLGLDTLPLRAEKSLFDLAEFVRERADLSVYIAETPTIEICATLEANPISVPLAGDFADRLGEHLARFGHTIYDLDFAKPVPADDPAPLIETIKLYLSGQAASPYGRQHAQIARREQAEQAISARLDPLRRRWFTRTLRWAQENGPHREDCIADLGLGYPMLRKMLFELGCRLVAGGAIAQPKDIYMLEASELDALAGALDAGLTLPVYTDSVEMRKSRLEKERQLNPPVSLPQKSFWTKVAKLMVHDNPDGSTLKGYAASAGKVTAPACVLRGPEDFSNMRPGDVIVAVTTTPAWTPLFAMASAVVTDIGGPLSHSSIVAREYGIPAVMATGTASRRIRNGQMLTVDGSAGIVTLQE